MRAMTMALSGYPVPCGYKEGGIHLPPTHSSQKRHDSGSDCATAHWVPEVPTLLAHGLWYEATHVIALPQQAFEGCIT